MSDGHTEATSTKIQDAYLGDGVYASYDGYGIILSLGNNQGSIYLDPYVLGAFDKYRAKCEAAAARERGSDETDRHT